MEAVAEITPDSLREQANALSTTAEQLRRLSRAKEVQAIRLRREADALEAALRLAPEGRTTTASARAELAGEVRAWLARCRESKSSGEIADHIGASVGRVRAALDCLIDAGEVQRTGLKRGTRYRLIREGETAATPQPFGNRWHEVVRDAAIKLGTFTVAEIAAELEGVCAEVTLRRWLRQLVDDGILSTERVGKAYLYAYEAPEANAPAHRRRVEPAPGRRRGSVAIEGTGRRKFSRPEVAAIVKEAQAQGAEIKPQKHGYAVIVEGETITSVPKTPSDHRSLKNAQADIRRRNGA